MANNKNASPPNAEQRKRPRILLFTLIVILIILLIWNFLGPTAVMVGVANVGNVLTLSVIAMCAAVLLFFLFTGIAMVIIGVLTLVGVVVGVLFFPFLFPVLIPLLIVMAVVAFLRR